MNDIRRLIFIVVAAGILIIGLCTFMADAYPNDNYRVQQGGNVTLNGTYELSGVCLDYYVCMFVHWNNWWDEDSNKVPYDKAINLKNKHNRVWINPDDGWVVGNWYKFDGYTNQRNANNFAFTIRYPENNPIPNQTVYEIKEVYVQSGNKTEVIPVVYTYTVTPGFVPSVTLPQGQHITELTINTTTPEPTPTVTIVDGRLNFNPNINPDTVPTIKIVTPKTSISILSAILALICLAVMYGKLIK